jgi:hypothetical protein
MPYAALSETSSAGVFAAKAQRTGDLHRAAMHRAAYADAE